MDEVVKRLKKAIAHLKGAEIITTQQDIVEKLGVNKTSVSQAINGNPKYLTQSFISKFCNVFTEINEDWIWNDAGQMLNSSESSGGVPYWNLPVSAGKSIKDIVGAQKPDGFINGLPGADIAENILPVNGASMEPEVSNGAIIGVRKMDNWESLNTERIYLIITHDDRMIKRIEHDEDNQEILWCVSPNYPKFKVYKTDIIEIQRVCFVYNPK